MKEMSFRITIIISALGFILGGCTTTGLGGPYSRQEKERTPDKVVPAEKSGARKEMAQSMQKTTPSDPVAPPQGEITWESPIQRPSTISSSPKQKAILSDKVILAEKAAGPEEMRAGAKKPTEPGSAEAKTPDLKESPPREISSNLPVQPPSASVQVFRDYKTGLAFTYQRPWDIIKTEWDGPNLGNGGSHLAVRFSILTTDKKKARKAGFLRVAAPTVGAAVVNSLQSVSDEGSGSSKKPATPLDVLLTKKHFPHLKIEQRYRGNDGRSIVQTCRQINLPDPIYVYHLFEGERVASFAAQSFGNQRLRMEMQEIVYSTHKP